MKSIRLICSIAALALCVIPRRAAAQSATTTGDNVPGSTFPPCPPHEHHTCKSFGVDFQNGGSYFQNVLSSSPFTFLSQFEGCQPDVAINFLVNDTNGDGTEFQCSDTNLTPSLVNMLSTCPIEKNALTSGDWSLVILSNNGNCRPIAYQRNFYLTVGPQQTVTITPTVTISSTSTPLSVVTSVVSAVTTSVGSAYFTITLLPWFFQPTVTLAPTVTVTTTQNLWENTITRNFVEVTPTVSTATATCSPLSKQSNPDPTCSSIPFMAQQVAQQWGIVPGSKARRVPFDAEERMMERRKRYAEEKELTRARPQMRKRDIDQPTITVTITNPAQFVTSTIISTAPTATETSLTTSVSTVISHPFVTTVYLGVTSVPVTITEPPVTITSTQWGGWGLAVISNTDTQFPFVRVVATPTAAAASCNAGGGVMR